MVCDTGVCESSEENELTSVLVCSQSSGDGAFVCDT